MKTNDDVITWNRLDIKEMVLDANMVLPHQSQEQEGDDAFVDDSNGDDTLVDVDDGD